MLSKCLQIIHHYTVQSTLWADKKQSNYCMKPKIISVGGQTKVSKLPLADAAAQTTTQPQFPALAPFTEALSHSSLSSRHGQKPESSTCHEPKLRTLLDRERQSVVLRHDGTGPVCKHEALTGREPITTSNTQCFHQRGF